MTEQEYLLIKLGEECSEVSHAVSKALRFSLSEIQMGHRLSNKEKLQEEIKDLIAIVEFLKDKKIIEIKSTKVDLKKRTQRILDWIDYSKSIGVL